MFKYFEPNKIFKITSKAPRYVLVLFIVVLTVGLMEALIISSEDYKQGHSVRIMYVHVPAAWMFGNFFNNYFIIYCWVYLRLKFFFNFQKSCTIRFYF